MHDTMTVFLYNKYDSVQDQRREQIFVYLIFVIIDNHRRFYSTQQTKHQLLRAPVTEICVPEHRYYTGSIATQPGNPKKCLKYYYRSGVYVWN